MTVIKKLLLAAMLLPCWHAAYCWGFYAHKQINYYAVFLLPPEMMLLYKPNINFLTEHAVDPDKRRYSVAAEGARHYIDIDLYGKQAATLLPENWNSAVAKFSADSLTARGIVPWWIQIMMRRLTAAFKERNQSKILKLSAELGHYIADAHVPLHASSNHNGQFSNQQGIHAFWESRLPELLADKEWDFFIGKAIYLQSPAHFIWKRVFESAAAADTVLKTEKNLSNRFGSDERFAFEEKNGLLVRQYSARYAKAYDAALQGMVERRMRQSIFAVASCWYTAWVNAGQPDLKDLANKTFTEAEMKEFEELDLRWKKAQAEPRSHPDRE
jgi:hypothetical protein